MEFILGTCTFLIVVITNSGGTSEDSVLDVSLHLYSYVFSAV